MNSHKALFIVCWLSVFALAAHSQSVPNPDGNRSIAITVTEYASTLADIVELDFGYTNYGKTRERTYKDNVVVSNQILSSLLEFGVPRESIETENISLHPNYDEDLPQEMREVRMFEATQKWTVRATATEGQKIVDILIRAGVNELYEIRWKLSDTADLHSQAQVAAIERARQQAESIAKRMNVSVGDLMRVRNTPPPIWPGKVRGGLLEGAVSNPGRHAGTCPGKG